MGRQEVERKSAVIRGRHCFGDSGDGNHDHPRVSVRKRQVACIRPAVGGQGMRELGEKN